MLRDHQLSVKSRVSILCLLLGVHAMLFLSGCGSEQKKTKFATVAATIGDYGHNQNRVEPRRNQAVPPQQGFNQNRVEQRMNPEVLPQQGFNTEAYDRIVDNSFLAASQQPLSTFSVDVDTASYSNVRRFLNEDKLPPKDAVRIEELVNYFHYDYPEPAGEHPISVTTEVAPCPWKQEHRLVRIGIQGKRIEANELPPRNLVYLVDVSGSMNQSNKLPLVKKALEMLVEQLGKKDRVALAVYAGSSGLVLPSTPGSDKQTILSALRRLEAGGSTNGAQGIQLAYDTAQKNFMPGAVNRVILATDGDFNVGVTDQGSLLRLIEEKRKGGVFLTVLGFGMGNLKDSTLEKLADHGNGHYAYIDSEAEARKVFVEEGAALVTIAKDVKIQVEFNPRQVEAYRLVGYENRLLRDQDFNDDKKDAGDIGAGHTVTALYEVVPAGQKADVPAVDPLKYQQPRAPAAASKELLTVKVRYKDPTAEVSKLLVQPLVDAGTGLEKTSAEYRFAAAVAGFGMLLRDSPHKGTATYAGVLELAKDGQKNDLQEHRTEFIQLVKKAQRLAQQPVPETAGR